MITAEMNIIKVFVLVGWCGTPPPIFSLFLHFRGTNLFGTCPLGGSEVDLQSDKSIQQVRTKIC